MTRFPVECNSDLGNRVTPYRVRSPTGSGRMFHLAIQPGRKMTTRFSVEYNCNLFNRVITYLKIGHCTTPSLTGFRRMVRSNISYRYSTGSQSDDAFSGWKISLVLPGPGRIFNLAIQPDRSDNAFPCWIYFPRWMVLVSFERVRLTKCILYATGYLNISVVCMPLEVNQRLS